MGTTRIGLIVNPIAGMGGSVGLKGTDGDVIIRARALGAKPVAPERCRVFLSALARHDEIQWLSAPGEMGSDCLALLNLPYTTVGSIAGETKNTDTVCIAQEMLVQQIDLLVFVGGDGTARDIYGAVGMRVPVVAVPAGVKIYSAAFAMSPRAAAALVEAFVDGAGVSAQEVLDIDESAFRADRLEVHFIGYLSVPDVANQIQPAKEGTRLTLDTLDNQRDIAAGFVEEMEEGTLYLLGPGTTVKAIADALHIEKTLLGVDAVADGVPVGVDLNEQGLLALMDRFSKSVIVVTPLGGNGFVFGRGNKQFTPEVLRRVGRENLVIVAAEEKIRNAGVLRIDTGDAALDDALAGYITVIVGYRIGRAVRVVAV